MLSKRVLVLISCLVGIAGLGVSSIGAPPALAETVAPPADPGELEKLRLAAEQGNAAAQYNLGVMYYQGRGVPQNDGEAVRYFRLAADQGLATAQFNLGLMYERGIGVARNYSEAYFWLSLAASDHKDSDHKDFVGRVFLNSAEIAKVQARVVVWKTKK